MKRLAVITLLGIISCQAFELYQLKTLPPTIKEVETVKHVIKHQVKYFEVPVPVAEKVYQGMSKYQLSENIGKVLKALNCPKNELEAYTNLLLYTALIESNMGIYTKQRGSGIAKGIFQMELATHTSLWRVYMPRNPNWSKTIKTLKGGTVKGIHQLETNLQYSIACAYMLYKWRCKTAPSNSWEQIAQYHKKYYNTYKGKSCPERGKKMAILALGKL